MLPRIVRRIWTHDHLGRVMTTDAEGSSTKTMYNDQINSVTTRRLKNGQLESSGDRIAQRIHDNAGQ